MSSRDGRTGPAHMAPSGRGRERARNGAASQRSSNSRQPSRAQREPLRDRYTYEEPSRGGQDTAFQDVSSYSSPNRQRGDRRELERHQGKGKMSKVKKGVLITLAVLVLLIGGGLWYVFGYMLKDLTVEPITKDPVKLGLKESDGADENAEYPVTLDDSVKNIAMFGVDARDASFAGRSDVIMILTVDNRHQKIKMTSIARDTCVDVSGYGYDKLAHPYAYEGPELAINTLNRNFRQASLRIEDYVTVNFAKMAEIIDACGGVEMDLTAAEMAEVNKNLSYLEMDVNEQIENDKASGAYEKNKDDYAQIVYTDYFYDQYGEVSFDSDSFEDCHRRLTGNQAVAYGRIRHLDSDNVRMERQQNVLKALIQRVKGKSKLEYPEMIRKIMPMCKTSLEFDDIMSMLPIIFTDFTIESITLPSEEEGARGALMDNGGWVYVYDWEAAAKRICNFIYEENSPYYKEEITPTDPGIFLYNSGDGTDGSYYDVPPPESEPEDPVYPLPEDPSSSSVSSVDPYGSGTSSSSGTGEDPGVDPNASGTSSSSGTGEDPGVDPNGGGVSSSPSTGEDPGVDSNGGGGGGGGDAPPVESSPWVDPNAGGGAGTGDAPMEGDVTGAAGGTGYSE